MPAITHAQLVSLQKDQHKIRNICILAHVDHGKTTLSDSLLASNGIISSKLSGKVRYLDSREDEQQRGITMKSSGISLYFKIVKNLIDSAKQESSTVADEYLVNLIDSPGHVDFSSEVSTASRLCDGALVLVDAVEGVCTQTHTVLRQAWMENVRPVLVLNKIDRLITELKLTSSEAYIHLNKILEQVNAIMGTFYSESMMQEDAARYEAYQAKRSMTKHGKEEEEEIEWRLEHQDDSTLYFSPDQGNVIFSSAIDGWAFRIEQFAQIYAAKLGIKEELLRRVLWGDYYLDPKTKRVLGHKGLKGRPLKPMFVQFVLDNLWALYDSVLETNDREKVEKIVKALNVKVLPRDMRSKDSRALLQAIMSQWLPLSSSVLLTVIEKIPSPGVAQNLRLPKILYPKGNQPELASLSESRRAFETAIYNCDRSDDVPVVAYVSKMFSVSADMLPTNRRVQLTAEEMRERRRAAIAKQQAAISKGETTSDKAVESGHIQLDDSGSAESAETGPVVLQGPTDTPSTPEVPEAPAEETLIGFARIYSGTIRVGQTFQVLGPKYDPAFPTRHRSAVTIEKLYLMMGRELQELKEVPAGNVFGIGGLGQHVLKSATLSSTAECPSFGGVRADAAPIVRVALEPREPNQMGQLIDGLRLLNQADPCVEVYLQETGEHVIVCAGELHLERCLKDLRERFAKIDIQVSPPIVPFRETVSTFPAIPLTLTPNGQKVEDSTDPLDSASRPTEVATSLPTGTAIVQTPDKLCTIRVRAVPLPSRVTAYLENQSKTMRNIVEERDVSVEQEGSGAAFIRKLKDVFDEAYRENEIKDKELWNGVVERLWAFGPKRIGPNLLVNNVPGYERSPWFRSAASGSGRSRTRSDSPTEEDEGVDAEETLNTSIEELSLDDGHIERRVPNIRHYEGSINAGFQLATLQGPLAAEPMMGVAFLLEEFTIEGWQEASEAQLSLLSGRVISMLKDACRQAFLGWSPRLMLAMYSCDLQAPAEVLGKVYAVLARRRGRILSEEMREGTPFFNIKSMLPVVESFGFADEIRKRTSGAASPQLIFSGFEVLDIDPFWVPTTEEELEDLGEKADRENLAKKYMEGVRKRKGLLVEKKIVEHAEKQRTLKIK
ncbi:small GTP-binding protein domain [Spizellomyces punctatus DAOM BR117]|uniref:Ribosome assembly protein 1 n=1 Tax=Spizellomyces punctatus (strain DAOM BR117) TaxID=645134 RepID=A0A0L0HBP9_SPIPD|nr:small GTP-binding protein domain [Spizellomyces punctatus DAOM BR117]KNC99015.1 small GTP-binding protein domain [Spizellomyces punctatus DAOM BR117]|eukprot:XP_016607055.1 small GTP-binding protein domain [Spizellomyces punctatus DAOM BR117]